jgi:hypothetical protein
MPKGRVRIREVPYKKVAEDVLGNQAIVYDTAYGPGWPDNLPVTRQAREPDLDMAEAEEEYRLGQVVDFLDDDYVRLLTANCIVKYDEETTEQLEEETKRAEEGFGDKTVEELTQWIRDERPTVNQVVEASGGDEEVARRLLEAESSAQDGDARKGVVDGLMAVIARA